MRSRKAIPPDHDRCEYKTIDGKRCTQPKDPLHRPMCDAHHRSIMAKFHASRIDESDHLDSDHMIAGESFLSPDQPLDSAQAINLVLTRIFRAVAEGRYPPRQAAALGYLGQLIISTLPGIAREAATLESNLEKNPVADRAAQILAELTSALRHRLPPEAQLAPDNSSTASILPQLAQHEPRR